MAITRRDPGVSLLLLTLLGLCAAGQSAWAQTPSLPEAPALASEPVPTTQIQPTLDVTLTATNNANGTSAGSAPRKDLILSTGAGATVNIKGANSQLAGRWRFTSVKYARNSQPNRVLPSGQLDLHSDLYRKEAGFDASLASEQSATSVGLAPDPNNTANTTTTTRFSLSPFFVKQFDSESSLTARLKRTWIQSTSNDSAQTNNNGAKDEHLLRWERKPMRLGYALEASYDKDPIFSPAGSNLPNSSLTRKKATASLLYAIVPELAAGPVLGRESSQFEGQSLSGTIRGAQLRWHPNEHTQLHGKLTHSVFGKEWELDASRKTAWTTFGFSSRREVETNAAPPSLAGFAASNAGATLPGPTSPGTPSTPSSPSGLSPASQANNLSAAAREITSGRMQFAGRRDNLNLTAGLTRSTPLGAATQRTKEYFLGAEVIHKLTPLSNLTGGLRWTRGSTSTSAAASTATNPASLTRDFTARLGLDTKLAPDTTATMGLKRQLTHNPSTSTSAESAAYVGLGYRF